MKRGEVWRTLTATIGRRPAHLGLVDPDKQGPERAGELAGAFFRAGSDGIMIGGSTGVDPRITDATVLQIRKSCPLPTILFPAGAACLSRHAHALFFMSLLNSRDRRFLIEEQRRGAPYVKRFRLEPISMGYIVFEPGMRVGEVGHAELVGRDDIRLAVEYAIAAELFGMACVYLESGSGAPEPLPAGTVRAVKRSVGIPVIVGGGVTSPESARAVVRAGADIVVTGTVAEFNQGRGDLLSRIVAAVRKG
ncbi:MAG: geranylgeranylglyceryl/heptaprenylglyceryl phosphate synthase [Euryarchaeota archaeon]|nr:geranylgeranylglyceryl/heptaprenylglyceryl phosphate synthase [Euryarchaeota archaeon]